METDPLEGANSADVEAALFLLLCGPSLFSLFSSSNKAVLFSAAQRNELQFYRRKITEQIFLP